MIQVGSTEIDVISVGSLPANQIYVGSTMVFPSGYYYTLTYKQTDYSSSDKLLYATGQNYATFTCYYRKYRSSNNFLVSTVEVTAIPYPPSYCKNDEYDENKLKFDYDNYKATQLPADSSVSVSLSYNGITATGYVSRQENSPSYSISPIVLDSSLVDASGGVVNYTGGEVITTWTSEYTNPTTPKANFTYPATNSQVNSVIGYITSYTSKITIESLARNATSGQSYYTFTSDSYGGQTVSVTVYQKQNAMHTTPATQSYFFYNSDNDTLYDSSIYVPAVPGASSTFRFKIKYDPLVWYDADPTKIGTGGRTLKAADYTVNVAVGQGGGCVTSVNIVGMQSTSEIYEVNYSPNPGTTKRSSILVAIANDYSWNTTIQVWQPPQ